MSYSSEVLADSPQGWYRLDETSGTTLADSSGNGRNGTWMGSPVRGVTGIDGTTGFTLGGGYGEVADASWNSFTGAFTVEAWHKTTGADCFIVEKYAGGFAMRLEAGYLRVYTLGGSTTSITSVYQATRSNWHHYAFTYDGTQGRLYIDGVIVAGPTTMAAPTDGSGTLKIGARGDDGVAWAGGNLDEVALYSTALSGTRVAAHFTAGRPTRDVNPKAYWKLDELSGTTMADSSGNGFNGTYSGAILGQTALRGTGYAAKGGTSGQGVASVAAAALSVFDSGEFTIAFDVNPTNTTSTKGYVSRWNSGGWIVLTSGSTINLYLDSGAAFTNMTGPSIGAGTSKRITITVKTGDARIYVDGALHSSHTPIYAAPSNAYALQIGGYGGSGYSEAVFDDVKYWDVALTSGEVSAEFAGSSASPVTVTAPVLAGTGALVAPVVTAGSAATVAAPVLAGSGALIAPTASTGSSVSVAAPVLAGSGTLVAPTVEIVSSVVVDVPTLAGSGALLAPDVFAGSSVAVTLPVLAGSGALLEPTVVTVAPGVFTAPVLTDAKWVSSEQMATLPDATVWAAKVETAARMRLPLVLSAPPLGVLNEWPLERQAHIMPALSAANPRYRGGIDYTIQRSEVGRLHVLVGGKDVTYLRGVPARFADYTSSVPFGPASASLAMPQMKPWDEPGTGDLSMFKADAKVEIAIARPDDTTELVWEGFLASDEDNSGENREDYTWHAEGLFAQAMHEPYDPPVYLPPTDPAHIIADVLNSVTHRRWNKIRRVNSGLPKVTDRGRPGQSKWQRVQDVLSKMLTTDGRQWTLVRTGPYTYVPALKATTAVADWTVTKGAPGVECSFVVDQATRRDAVYGRGFAPDGGYWEGRVFPGLEFGIPPRYPMNNTALNLDGRSDSTTDTGNGITLWQRKMRELGYPVTVDGVMNSADAKWVRKIQRDRALTVDGSLGPQTWAATWENNSTEMDLTTYRLPLATRTNVEPYRYSASGARVGFNHADDKSVIRHAMPEVDFGSGIKKSDAIALAQIILDRESDPGVQGRIVLTTDPHEAGASRFSIKPGDNVHVIGHRDGVTFQVSEVSVSDLSVTLTVDSKARDSLAVEAILERNEEARRDVSSRTGKTTDGSSLNKSAVVQYESESRAGFVPRTAVNGNSGLWTVRKTFVSQIGVAKVEFDTSPNAELVVALFNRPIRISVLESLIGAPLTSSDGWYDNIEKLQDKYGLMEVFGSDSSPGGYWPRQKGDGPLTGKLRDASSILYDSPFGGFVWVAMFTSKSAWVQGRVFPATEQ